MSTKKYSNELSVQKSRSGQNYYDPFQRASLERALIHLKATSVNSGTSQSDPLKICLCCGNTYDVKSYSFCCKSDDFSNYGVSYSSFFRLIKFLILVLCVNFLISGLITLLKVEVIWDCTFSNSCEYWLLPNEYQRNKVYTHSFALVNILLIIVIKNIYFYYIKKFDHDIDLGVMTANDFTAFVKGIPKDASDDEIKNCFKNINGKEYEVVKMNRIYRIKKAVEKVEAFMQIEKEIKTVERKKKPSQGIFKKMEKLSKKLTTIKKDLNKIQEEFRDPTKIKNKFSGDAFITFSTEKDLHEILLYFKPSLCWNSSKKLKVTRACAPSDIYWSNYGLKYSEILYRRIVSIGISLLLILLCFFIILKINKYQIELQKDFQENIAFLLSIVISLTIITLNFALRYFLFKSTDLENRETYSFHYTSIVGKMTLTLFANEALIILISNYINDSPENLFALGGVGKNMLVVMLVGVYLNPILIFFDPSYYFLKLQRYYYSYRLKNKNHDYLQYEINAVFENPVFNVSEVHYVSLKTLTVAVFYQAVLPWGLLLGVFGLTLNYFAWKWRFIYRSQIPKELDFSFTKGMMRYFDFAILLTSLGYLTFDILLTERHISDFTIAMLVICGVEFVLDHFGYILLFFKKNHEYSEEKYIDKWHTFANDYDRLNPITQRVAYTTYLEKIGIIHDKVDKVNLQNNYLANIYDYVASNNIYGCGTNNCYQKDNPFIKIDSLSSENILGIFNFYNVEKDARKKVVDEKIKNMNKLSENNSVISKESESLEKKSSDKVVLNLFEELGEKLRKNSFEKNDENQLLGNFIRSRINSRYLNCNLEDIENNDETNSHDKIIITTHSDINDKSNKDNYFRDKKNHSEINPQNKKNINPTNLAILKQDIEEPLINK